MKNNNNNNKSLLSGKKKFWLKENKELDEIFWNKSFVENGILKINEFFQQKYVSELAKELNHSLEPLSYIPRCTT